MISRVLEPEVMDSAEDAAEYDTMDHSAVNDAFVTDLFAAIENWSPPHPMGTTPGRKHLRVLDLGIGTGQIPIELAQRALDFEIVGVDAAESMLAIAKANIAAAKLDDRIDLFLADAKDPTFDSYSFPVVISNSIVHHIPDPRQVIAEAIRVTKPGGLLFHRDLARPNDEAELNRLVATYAANATPYQRRLFAESLHAALTAEEIQDLVAEFGFERHSVRMTSDRHWTWTASKT